MSHYQTNAQKTKEGMALCCKLLRDPERIPAEGAFQPCRVFFQYRGSKNEAMFCLEHQHGDQRRLSLTVARPGSDMVVFHYMKKGTNQELIDYLSDPNRVSEFMESFQKLSDSVDDKHD